MIAIGDKPNTNRIAIACGTIIVGEKAFNLIINNQMPKGDVLALANISGISGAKSAPLIMPLCHPLLIDHIGIEIEPNNEDFSFTIYCTATCFGKTGVEMEALSGVNAALLNIWDTTKMIEANLKITNVRLLAKKGGKSGIWLNTEGVPETIKKVIEAWK